MKATSRELAMSMLCRLDRETEKVVADKIATSKTAERRRRWLEVQEHVKQLRKLPEWTDGRII